LAACQYTLARSRTQFAVMVGTVAGESTAEDPAATRPRSSRNDREGVRLSDMVGVNATRRPLQLMYDAAKWLGERSAAPPVLRRVVLGCARTPSPGGLG